MRSSSPPEMHYHSPYCAGRAYDHQGPRGAVSHRVTPGGKKGLILLDQMSAVDKLRLTKKLGSIPAKTLSAALYTLQEIFAE
jgi:mRNA interferase MazF